MKRVADEKRREKGRKKRALARERERRGDQSLGQIMFTCARLRFVTNEPRMQFRCSLPLVLVGGHSPRESKIADQKRGLAKLPRIGRALVSRARSFPTDFELFRARFFSSRLVTTRYSRASTREITRAASRDAKFQSWIVATIGSCARSMR